MAYNKKQIEKWTQSYLNQINAPAPSSAPTAKPDRFAFSPSSTGGGEFSAPVAEAPPPPGPSVMSRVFDIVMRPQMAFSNVVDEATEYFSKPTAKEKERDRDLNKKTENPFEAFWMGLSGKEKEAPSEILREHSDFEQLPGWLQGTLGISADVILDPINLIPAAWIAKPIIAGAKQASKVTKSGRQAIARDKALAEAEKHADYNQTALDAREAAAAKADPDTIVAGDPAGIVAREASGTATPPPAPTVSSVPPGASGEWATKIKVQEDILADLLSKTDPKFPKKHQENIQTVQNRIEKYKKKAAEEAAEASKVPTPVETPTAPPSVAEQVATPVDPRSTPEYRAKVNEVRMANDEYQKFFDTRVDLISAGKMTGEQAALMDAEFLQTINKLEAELKAMDSPTPVPEEVIPGAVDETPVAAAPDSDDMKSAIAALLAAKSGDEARAAQKVIDDLRAREQAPSPADTNPTVEVPKPPEVTPEVPVVPPAAPLVDEVAAGRPQWSEANEATLRREVSRKKTLEDEIAAGGQRATRAQKEIEQVNANVEKLLGRKKASSAIDDQADAMAPARQGEAPSTPEAQAKAQKRVTDDSTIDAHVQGRDMIGFSKKYREIAKKGGLKYDEQNAAVRQSTHKALKDQTAATRAAKREPFITGANGRRYEISTDEIMDAAFLSKGAEKELDSILFNSNRGIGPDSFHAGAAEAIRHTDEGLTYVARETKIKLVKAAIEQAMTKEFRARHAKRPNNIRAGLEKQLAGDIEAAAVRMVDAADEMALKVAKNRNAMKSQIAADAAVLAKAVDTVIQNVTNPATPASQSIPDIVDLPKTIEEQAKAINASPEATKLASESAAEQMAAKGVDPEHAKSMNTTVNAANNTPATPAGQAQLQQVAAQQSHAQATQGVKQIDDAARAEKVPEYDLDLDLKYGMQIEGLVEKTLFSAGKKFLGNHWLGDLGHIWRGKRSSASSSSAQLDGHLNQIARQWSEKDINDMYDTIRKTADGTVPPGMTADQKALFNAMREATELSWDTYGALAGKSPLFGAFHRQGYTWDEINKALRERGVGHQFDLTPNGKTLSNADIAKQWSTWKPDNPLKFMKNSFEALQDLATKKAIAGHAMTTWGSRTPRAGYVKLTASKEGSELINFFDKKLYFPKEAAQMIHNLEWVLKQSTDFKGGTGATAKLVTNVLDPLQQMWKSLITIARPSHHPRNMIGDASASTLDGVYSITPYRKATRMLMDNRQKKELTEKIKQIGELTAPVELKQLAKDASFSVRLAGGAAQHLDEANFHKLAYQEGIMPLFTNVEDILSSTDKGLGRVANALQNTKYMKAMGKVSEKSSHVGRYAHYIALMERKNFTKKYKTLEDASRAAAARVRKFHPDSSGLAPFEQKYMRRAFPFYSWFRQAAPLAIARFAVKPARMTDITKAQYNVAMASGVNPNSIADPFPPDANIPSWMRSSVTGPYTPGGLMANFGTMQESILSGQFLNQTPDSIGNPAPVKNVLNLLNPLIKAPIELGGGKSLTTSLPIQDTSDYVDTMIPGFGMGKTLGNWSPSGTLLNVVQGNTPTIDPTRARTKYGEDAWEAKNIINFLLGGSFQDINSPAAQSTARYERIARQNAPYA